MTKSHKRSPRHLSDTALIVLGRAADSENQMLLPIPKSVRARGKALERVLLSLLRQGFVEEAPVGLADEAWRSDVGQHQIDPDAALQDRHGLVRIGCFEHHHAVAQRPDPQVHASSR